MNKINTIDELLSFLEKIKTTNQVEKANLLTKYHQESSIDKIIVQLKKGQINEISLSDLEEIMNDFGIEEYDLFLRLKRVLDRYDMSDSLNNSAETKQGLAPSRDDAIQYILTFISDLQELLKDKNLLEEETKSELEKQGIETELIEDFRRILISILRELEIKRVLDTEEYKQLYKNVKELTNVYSLIKESTSRILSQEEKDIIYNYLVNSKIENKLTIYTLLVSSWFENARTLSSNKGINPENIIPLEKPITDEIIEKVNENIVAQKKEIQIQMKKRTKEDWIKLFKETINSIRENTKLTSIQKDILEKILLNGIKISSEDLNLYEELLSYHKEINLDSRKNAYTDLENFDESEFGTTSIDLSLNLIPNIENSSLSEVNKIIEYIIDKYNQCYMSQDEIQEVNELIRSAQESYPDLSYVEYSDSRKIYLEERFEELDGNKERLINAATYNNSQLDEGYDFFIENTFKKIIKTKLEELIRLVNLNTDDLEQIKKGKIPNLRNQLEYWMKKYSEYTISKEIKEPYRQYTIEDIQNIDFSNQNAIIFLNGENGITVYEEGFLKNGLNQNGTFQSESLDKARNVITKAVNATKEELTIDHAKFASYVEDNNQGKGTSGTSKLKHANHLIINEHFLIRLSLGHEARVTAIDLNRMPEINKKKIGISPEKTVLLIVGVHEVNHDRKSRSYGKMRNEARKYEDKISTIISVFENPWTPKETLLNHIASSYGLLVKITGKEPQQSKENKRGGKL